MADPLDPDDRSRSSSSKVVGGLQKAGPSGAAGTLYDEHTRNRAPCKPVRSAPPLFLIRFPDRGRRLTSFPDASPSLLARRSS
jgi:hypothetical protein